MTSLDSFPGPSGITDDFEAGKDLAGLIVRSAAGVPRAGVFGPASLIVARSDFKVDVLTFASALVRTAAGGSAVRFSGNDGTVTVPAAPLSAPASNQKYAIVYQKQNETARADANNTSVIDVVQGAANASAATALANARALLPAGALEIGTILIPSTATATDSPGVVITTTAPITAAAGARVPVRSTADLAAWVPDEGALAWQIDNGVTWERAASEWVAIASPWFSYTPTFTNFTPGTSALDFKWRYAGHKLVFLDWKIVLASGFAMGSTPTATLPLPSAPVPHPHATISMNVSLYDVSAAIPREAYMRANVSSATSFALVGGSPSAPVTINGTSPFQWNLGDVLQGQAFYRLP